MGSARVKRLFRFVTRSRDDVERDVHDEFAFHLEMRVADLRRDGLADGDARRQALDEFGDLERGAAGCAAIGARHEQRRALGRWLDDLVHDVRFAGRLIARNRGFSAVAVLTLAVAIGGNTALFSLIDAIVLKRLPVSDPDRLVSIHPGESRISWPNLRDIREGTQVFADVAAHAAVSGRLGDADARVTLMGETVTSNYFTTLGVGAALGRTILPGDTRTDIVVLSDRTWRRYFGADRAVVGRPVAIDRRTYEVVGVMPPRFRGLAPPGLVREFWRPLDMSPRNPAFSDRAAPRVQAFARLAPGVSRAAATAAVRVVTARIRSAHPDASARLEATTLTGIDGIEAFRGVAGSLLPVLGFLGLLSIISTLVLLVGCANLAGLLLGRAASRQREIGVRLALGASRSRLLRQLLTESTVLALLGGAAGTLLAVWSTRAVYPALDQLPFPVELDLSVDWRVLAYGLALSFVTAAAFGLVPARRAARVDLVPSLRIDADADPRRQWFRRALVLAQVSACALLLLWSGLFVRSLSSIRQVDPGFDPRGVVLADISLDSGVPDRDEVIRRLLPELQQRVSAVPGVDGAGAVWAVPLSLRARADYAVYLPGEPSGSSGTRVVGNSVTPGWFDVMKIRLLSGRDFTWQDGRAPNPVVIVNDTLSRRLFDGSAVGRTIRYYGRNDVLETAEIVGVVSDSKYWTLGESIAPTVYQPLQRDPSAATLAIRTGNANAAASVLRTAARAVSPGVDVTIKSMDEAIAVALMPARVGAIVTATFGALAALLSMLGIYGLVSFTVTQRTREIGIRKAVGASPAAIVALIARGMLRPVCAGLILGTTAGALGARVFGGLLVNISPHDPATLTVVAVLVLATAVTAAAVPAASALAIDPARTLKSAE